MKKGNLIPGPFNAEVQKGFKQPQEENATTPYENRIPKNKSHLPSISTRCLIDGLTLFKKKKEDSYLVP